MADHIQDSLLREIDEELRQEKYAKLWKKYGNYVVAAAVLLVVAVAGYQGWRSWDLKTRTEQSDHFLAALDLRAQGNNEAARKALAELAADAGKGYATLSRLQEAAALDDMGDRKGAVAAYAALANDGSAPERFRQLAVVLGALLEVDSVDPNALSDRLAPLTVGDNPWRHTAQELTGLLAIRSGNVEKARQIFKQLSEDASTPQTQRSRASEMLAILG